MSEVGNEHLRCRKEGWNSGACSGHEGLGVVEALRQEPNGMALKGGAGLGQWKVTG